MPFEDVREATWQFLIDYGEPRPHSVPGGMTAGRGAPQSPRQNLYF
ncbi:hypothetical protein [Luteimonas sp. SDU101]